MTEDPQPIPDGSLLLLVGPPAAGKSTLAAELVERGLVAAVDVLSTDAYREAITGDAGDTSRDRAVFSALRRGLDDRLRAGRTTVVDSTNLWPAKRGRHIRVAQAHGRPVVAVRVDVPVDALLARNRRRARRVPAGAVVLMERQMRAAVRDEVLLAEGCDVVLSADELRERARRRPIAASRQGVALPASG